MSFNEKTMIDLLKMINDSDYGFVSLEHEGSQLSALKKDMDLELMRVMQGNNESATPARVEPSPVSSTTAVEVETVAVAVAEKNNDSSSTESSSQSTVDDNHIVVRAPMLGTFFRRPSPEEAEYVKQGDVVQASDTICLIEVMKLFNSITAGQKGTIVEILVEDGEMVEYDQPLFVINPVD